MYDEHQVLKVSGHICQVYLMTPDIRRFSLAVVALVAIGARRSCRAAGLVSEPDPHPGSGAGLGETQQRAHARRARRNRRGLRRRGPPSSVSTGSTTGSPISARVLRTRARRAWTGVQQELQRRLGAEKDALVRQDLEILHRGGPTAAARASTSPRSCCCRTSTRLKPSSTVCARCSTTRCRRSGAGRRWPACGSTPAPRLASSRSPSSRMERVRERLAQKELLGPFKDQVERDLGNIGFFASGLDELFKKYDMPDAAPHLATLKTQFAAVRKSGACRRHAAHANGLQTPAGALCEQPRTVRRRHPAGGPRRGWRTAPSTRSRKRCRRSPRRSRKEQGNPKPTTAT